jgi:hypothetical protein
MKHFILFALFFSFDLAAGQSIHITSVSKDQICAGETNEVHYTASGSFASDNIFYAQITNEYGKFVGSQNVGQDTRMIGSIAILGIHYPNHYRVRVFSTDPFIISDTSSDIHVYWPQPQAKANLRKSRFGWIGFAGEPLTFFDGIQELPGTIYHWKFNQDSHVNSLFDSSAIVVYPTMGWKNATLTVTNPLGCDSTDPFQMFILSCNPVIPGSTHIVTGTESGTYPYVWVKAGGNYRNLYQFDYYKNFSTPTIFVDSGGMVAGGNAAGIYYVQDNATFKILGGETAIIVLKKKWVNYPDTIYCPDLQFDYSQVNKNKVESEEFHFQVEQTSKTLHVTNENAEISGTVFSPLGIRLFSKTERNTLELDLSSLAEGMYFTVITSGKYHEVRKILVMH